MITEAEKLIADGPQQMNNLCLGGCGPKNYLSSYKYGVACGQRCGEHWPLWLGGVGKTTLLTKLNNKFSTTPNVFEVVIWAFVSKDSDDSWKNKSVDQKAPDIYGVLRNKRFIVLLDDLWERVDLNQVGIPKPSQENVSELIFTTQSSEVCAEMEAQKKIKVKCLETEKAWELFRDKVEDETLNSHPDIPNLAKQVAERCGGQPLVLITIGSAMACKKTLGE
ncbi:hypothetical protein V6Z11_A06G226800 [Gossypium hirsutum]|uniref:Probable disease resistance protein At4g14610 n=1 Tax=Gossypium hirsutum TaxID=3635 RepID=A0ABM3BWJ6_GOSHI|nr:probable disease resistance protein At4g14610 [Gossypium arboreum]XP_040971426.1 probable disease resistance protein At4g14610 [Gossypium hirsutum]